MSTLLFKKLAEDRKHISKVLKAPAVRNMWRTIVDKYSDQAHFIYELLQNADDAEATECRFTLTNTDLQFVHNGKIHFTLTDPENEDNDSISKSLGHINSLTSVANSNKVESKIGKYGVGFKAVYQYTRTPEIYDDFYKFKLVDYIIPEEVHQDHPSRKKGETLFVFPFNHEEKDSLTCISEIQEKLKGLYQPLLFLTNLNYISWSCEELKGEYNKTIDSTVIKDDVLIERITLSNTAHEKYPQERIFLFSKLINHPNKDQKYKISIGYFFTEEKKLETGFTYTAYCFFPTKEDTNFGFIFHAPFLLTDSREKIRANEKWNDDIVVELGGLLGKSIELLKEISLTSDYNLLDDSIFEILPFENHEYKDKVSFQPFFQFVASAFRSGQVIPGRSGKYFCSRNAYWASDPELISLFSDKQLSILMDNPDSGWVFTTKSQKQINQSNRKLEQFINSIVVDTVDPRKILRKINAEFIENQSIAWLKRLYTYLEGRKYLWESEKIVQKLPILLNQKNQAIAPFGPDGVTPQIFLPTGKRTSYHVIHKEFLDHDKSMSFFKSIGIEKPDISAEIFHSIIPAYISNPEIMTEEDHLMHMLYFIEHFENSSQHKIDTLIDKLKTIPFLASNNKAGVRKYLNPEEVYESRKDLFDYFEGCSDIYFVDIEFYNDIVKDKSDVFQKFIHELGVNDIPKIITSDLETSWTVREQFDLVKYELSNRYGNQQSITDRNLEGLSNLLLNISFDKSALLWNYLLQTIERNYYSLYSLFSGEYKYVPFHKQSFHTVRFDSTLICILQKEPWLYNSTGQLLAAKNIVFDDINPNYVLSSQASESLLSFLGIEYPEEDNNLSGEQKSAVMIGRRLIKEGISETELSELLSIYRNKLTNQETPEVVRKVIKTIGEKKSKKLSDLVPNEAPRYNEKDNDDFNPSAEKREEIEDKIRQEVESKAAILDKIDELSKIANNADKYSFEWFNALLELELYKRKEVARGSNSLFIFFHTIELEAKTTNILVLKSNQYISQSIEDAGTLTLTLNYPDSQKTLNVEAVSRQGKLLKAKLPENQDITNLSITSIKSATVELKNAGFLFENLRDSFNSLGTEFPTVINKDYNFKSNLPEDLEFIFGPPGTGKTTYLVTDKIYPFTKTAEFKILILTPTNKAADVLCKKIIEYCEQNDDLTYLSWLRRFGITNDESLENTVYKKDNLLTADQIKRVVLVTTIARFTYDRFVIQTKSPLEFGIKYFDWDFVIYDEASMINLPSIIYSMYYRQFKYSETRYLIAGDPFQIPPIVLVDEASWGEANIYSMVNLSERGSFTKPQTAPHSFKIQNLTTQYRSIPPIGELFSSLTYDNVLKHKRSNSDIRPFLVPGINFKPITLIDYKVNDYLPLYKANSVNNSHYQIYSCLFIYELLVYIDRYAEFEGIYNIGIICPYRFEQNLIDKLLSSYKFKSSLNVTTGTIHGFQGDECDLIFAVFNPPKYVSQSPNCFLNKLHIINVAISRARDYLIMLMPWDDSDNNKFTQLYHLESIKQLLKNNSIINPHVKSISAKNLENIICGSSTYIEDNSFPTNHQSVNIYSKLDKKYEIRYGESAVDIQLNIDTTQEV